MADETEDILKEKRLGDPTKKIMMLIIIISVVFLVMMGTGFYILWNRASPPDPQVEKKQEKVLSENEQDKIRPVFSLESFIVNLADRGGTRYLRTTMDLELTSEETTAEVEKRLPQIRDAILMILPAKTAKDINTIEGKTALRDEIMEKLNSFIKNGSVTNIYFTEFVIQ